MPQSCKVLLLFVLVVGIQSSSQTRREDEPYCVANNLQRVDIANADATILGLTIGRVSLKDVQARLGSAATARVSSEEESDVFVCYISPADGTLLVFYSGAMGGWVDITRFALWSREAAFPHASQCTPSRLVSRSLATTSGLRLGLDRDHLKRILGKATKSEPALIKYEYICRRKMNEAEIKGFKTANNWDVSHDPYFDRMSWIDVGLMDSRASSIEIGRIESY